MLVAINDLGERVLASNATKDKKYYCPVCNEDVILKQGKTNITHFAHKSCECTDNWQYDMSEWHINMQSYFDKIYQEVVITRNGKKHRADILKDRIVVEFQHSPISSKEFMDRNKFYVSAGLKVIWVFDVTKQIDNGQLEWNYNKDNMMKWKQPLRILWNTKKPDRKNDVCQSFLKMS